MFLDTVCNNTVFQIMNFKAMGKLSYLMSDGIVL